MDDAHHAHELGFVRAGGGELVDDQQFSRSPPFQPSPIGLTLFAIQAAIPRGFVEGVPVGEEVVAESVVVVEVSLGVIHEEDADRRPRRPGFAGTGATDERQQVGIAGDKRRNLILHGG